LNKLNSQQLNSLLTELNKKIEADTLRLQMLAGPVELPTTPLDYSSFFRQGITLQEQARFFLSRPDADRTTILNWMNKADRSNFSAYAKATEYFDEIINGIPNLNSTRQETSNALQRKLIAVITKHGLDGGNTIDNINTNKQRLKALKEIIQGSKDLHAVFKPALYKIINDHLTAISRFKAENMALFLPSPPKR